MFVHIRTTIFRKKYAVHISTIDLLMNFVDFLSSVSILCNSIESVLLIDNLISCYSNGWYNIIIHDKFMI